MKKPRDIKAKIEALTKAPRAEAAGGVAYWCMKDKPGPTCLIGGPGIAASELLAQVTQMGTFTWDGVRDGPSNEFLMKMKPGDQSCLYHGGSNERAVVGLLEIVSEPRPDPSAWDPDSPCVFAVAFAFVPMRLCRC